MTRQHCYGVLGLLFVLIHGGCCQQMLRVWAKDEVVVQGVQPRDADQWDLIVDVKNIASMRDGRYFVPLPPVAMNDPVHLTPDGVREHAGVPIGELTWRSDIPWDDPLTVDYISPRIVPTVELHAGALEAKEPFRRDPRQAEHEPTFGTMVLRDSDRRFSIQVFVFNDQAEQWDRLGQVGVGRGTQWPTRPLILVLWPLAWIVDVALGPIYLLRNQAKFGCCLGSFPL